MSLRDNIELKRFSDAVLSFSALHVWNDRLLFSKSTLKNPGQSFQK